MNIRRRHVYHLMALITILAMAAFWGQTRSLGKTSASSTPYLPTRTATNTETVEETVTLSAADLKTWSHGYQWYAPLPYCGPPFHMFPSLDDVPGSIVAGFEHYYDKGKKVFGCPDGAQSVLRGTVWFDLKDVVSKAPPLHVFVKSAALHFKKDRDCLGQELLIADKDWLKGFKDGDLVPGEPFAKIPSCESGDCVVDVQTVVNNWVRGEEHGGYANHGFVFKGPVEADEKWGDNEACLVRYSDLSLTVTYKYDKTPSVTYVRAPERPGILVSPGVLDTRKNVALASNGATATAQNYTQDGVLAGAHFQPPYAIDGVLHIHPPIGDLYWRDEHGLPSWLQIDFNGSKTINEIDVFTVADAGDYLTDPTATKTFTQYGATAFDVQYWNGSTWAPVPGGSITGNNLVWRKINFPAITTSKIRVVVNASPDTIARIVELEAWTK